MNAEKPRDAAGLLNEANACITKRAAERGQEEERSMKNAVEGFNGVTGRDLTEEEGNFFMVCLKMARAHNSPLKNADDYIDGAAYFALAGESTSLV